MDLGQKIKSVDVNYPVENIKVNGKQFWPFFRVFFFDAQYVKGGTQTSFSLTQKLQFLLSSFYGIFNWFGKTEYLVFSNSDQRKEVNGKWIDKSADYLNLKLPHTLHIELPVFKHFSHSKLKFKRVVSHLPLRFLEVVYMKLILRKVSIEGMEILNQLNEKFELNISGTEVAKRFLAQYSVMKFILRFIQPKAVFMAVPYMKMGYVLAIKENGIPVIEMQHGSINNSHFGYTNYKQFDASLFPNYLLAYGEGTKDVFVDGNITYSSETVFPIGHYYLHLIDDNVGEKNKLAKQLSGAQKTIAVSLQDDSVGSKIVAVLTEVAQKKSDWKFVFVPRKTPQKVYEKMNLPPNILFAPELNVYEVIAICDYHTTVFSTCALEAPTLGKGNVLVNINNKSKEYFDHILTDNRVTRFANSATDFINELEKGDFPNALEIKKSNNRVMVSGFEANLQSALQEMHIL
tara:strand:- start:122214 stop:123593 length:1380 start_codon:yes stop_codon:yes gene_type:complete